MKRILSFVSCIIRIPAIIAGAIESDKNAELFQASVYGQPQANTGSACPRRGHKCNE